jgi:hypothetical protein
MLGSPQKKTYLLAVDGYFPFITNNYPGLVPTYPRLGMSGGTT